MIKMKYPQSDKILFALEFSEPCIKYADVIYDESEMMDAVSKAFAKYKIHGARSPEKLKPLHLYVASVLSGIWGSDFRVRHMCGKSKEMTVEGMYYPKVIDITITNSSGEPIFCLGVKFITSNYKQNANNYFECMMGETANIQALKNIPYVQLLVFRYKTPYYAKNETEIPSKIEIINDDDIRKYVRLLHDSEQAHRPKYIGIQFVDIDETARTATPINFNQSAFSPDIKICLPDNYH